jgi:hypothetical protein
MNVQIDMIQYCVGLEDEEVISINIYWSCEKGFGNFLIKQTISDGELVFSIDNEMMDRDFIKRVLCAIVDKSRLESDARETD